MRFGRSKIDRRHEMHALQCGADNGWAMDRGRMQCAYWRTAYPGITLGLLRRRECGAG